MEYAAERLQAELKRLDEEGRKGLKRILDANPEHNVRALGLASRHLAKVTFRDFQQAMVKRKHTVDDLVDRFHGLLDENRSFFERVMSCQWRNPDTGRLEDRGDVVIPYRSVLKFYFEELHYLEASEADQQQLALKRKHRKPMSAERRAALVTQAARGRAAKSVMAKK
jgi:hypothetical protein